MSRSAIDPASMPLMDLPTIAARVAQLDAWVHSDWYQTKAINFPRDRQDARDEVQRLREALQVLRLRDYQKKLDAHMLDEARLWVEADRAETEAELLETMGRSMPRCPGGSRCRHRGKWRHKHRETLDAWVARLREQRRRVHQAAADLMQT
jgi:hypothetical protein